MTLYGREEIAWFAGFYEGEGNIHNEKKYRDRNGLESYRISKKVYLRIGQCNLEPLLRAQDVFDLGGIYGPYKIKGGTKPFYNITYRGLEECQAVFAAIYPWLSQDRKEQFIEALY